MEKEKSCGAIVFIKNKKIKYLLLYKKASKHYRETWDFPKGNIEKGENEEEAAKREVKEEAGIDVKIISGFKEKIKFFYKNEGKLIYKEVTFFLAEARQSEVKISVEHNDYKWATYKEALKLLTFKNSKEILKRANEFLQKFKQKNIKDFL